MLMMQLVMTAEVAAAGIGQISGLPVRQHNSASQLRMLQRVLLLVLELDGAVNKTYT